MKAEWHGCKAESDRMAIHMTIVPPEPKSKRKPAGPPRVRRRGMDRRRREEYELIDEIVTAAERIVAARHADGKHAVRADQRWRLLCAIERSPYCLSISDAARRLCIPRQRAHEVVTAAARSGEIEVLPNRDDKRILQVFLTPVGRATLSAARSRRSTWTAILLNGLGEHELRATIHILRVIRHRLLRDERERSETRRPRGRRPVGRTG